MAANYNNFITSTCMIFPSAFRHLWILYNEFEYVMLRNRTLVGEFFFQGKSTFKKT